MQESKPRVGESMTGRRDFIRLGVGAAAAIANAVFHATGKRIRDLPITPEKLLSLDASHARAIQRRQYVRK